MNRRQVLKLGSAAAAAALPIPSTAEPARKHDPVSVWDNFELTFQHPVTGNPFLDASLTVDFSLGHRTVRVQGFYDGMQGGSGIFRARFLPDAVGEWSYSVTSNLAALHGQQGQFSASSPRPGARGPIRVQNIHHFAYADGTPFFPFGTTCYAWIHQSDALQQQTLKTLASAPFNKIRMCVFPKSYDYNHNEPALYPFERDSNGTNDFTRPNPAFFQHLEQRIADLRALNIQADLILFHPYDRWGYATMKPEEDDRYLRYVLARLSAYPNIWWSLANEYDFMRAKRTSDFDRFFHIIEQYDPVAHLRSIHYGDTMYDYAHPWVTHASLQTASFSESPARLAAWQKPIMYDEVMYEGNLNSPWGNLSGDEQARRFWLGVMAGCYVTHGETYLDPTQPFDKEGTPTLWWAHGGTLKGSSPAQIAFLRKLVEQTVPNGDSQDKSRVGLEAQRVGSYLSAVAYQPGTRQAQTILYYFDSHQPIWYEFNLPEGKFTAEHLDPAAATIRSIDGIHSGRTKLTLTGRPFQAVRFTVVAG